jgi:hypothetical protein
MYKKLGAIEFKITKAEGPCPQKRDGSAEALSERKILQRAASGNAQTSALLCAKKRGVAAYPVIATDSFRLPLNSNGRKQ